jgi:hypothetical protein
VPAALFVPCIAADARRSPLAWPLKRVLPGRMTNGRFVRRNFLLEALYQTAGDESRVGVSSCVTQVVCGPEVRHTNLCLPAIVDKLTALWASAIWPLLRQKTSPIVAAKSVMFSSVSFSVLSSCVCLFSSYLMRQERTSRLFF